MTKTEFLEGLRRALSSTRNPVLINENLVYYSSYIDGELGKGRSEAEIMEELGDPRLIANSIRDAAGIDDDFDGGQYGEPDRENEGYGGGYESESEFSQDGRGRRFFGDGFRVYNIGGGSALILMIVLILVLFSAIWIFGKIVGGIVSLLSPVVGPIMFVLIIMWFMKMFRR